MSSSPSDVAEWSLEDVCAWVASFHDLSQYVPSFQANDIDGATLLTLSAQELHDDLYISSLGHRKKILREIEYLRLLHNNANKPPTETQEKKPQDINKTTSHNGNLSYDMPYAQQLLALCRSLSPSTPPQASSSTPLLAPPNSSVFSNLLSSSAQNSYSSFSSSNSNSNNNNNQPSSTNSNSNSNTTNSSPNSNPNSNSHSTAPNPNSNASSSSLPISSSTPINPSSTSANDANSSTTKNCPTTKPTENATDTTTNATTNAENSHTTSDSPKAKESEQKTTKEETENKIDLLETFPDEIKMRILSFVPQFELLNTVRNISFKWKRLALSDSLWSTVLMSGFRDVSIDKVLRLLNLVNQSRTTVKKLVFDDSSRKLLVSQAKILHKICPRIQALSIESVQNTDGVRCLSGLLCETLTDLHYTIPSYPRIHIPSH